MNFLKIILKQNTSEDKLTTSRKSTLSVLCKSKADKIETRQLEHIRSHFYRKCGSCIFFQSLNKIYNMIHFLGDSCLNSWCKSASQYFIPFKPSMINSYHIYVMFCAIWYHLYNFKNVINTYGRVLLSVKLHD